MNYKETQRKKQIELINQGEIYHQAQGGGRYRKVERAFILKEGKDNFYADNLPPSLSSKVKEYFKKNKISWWMGKGPTGHVLSSQIACLNHLFLIRNDKKAVLKLLQNISPAFNEVCKVPCDEKETQGYIAFEVVSTEDHLNENFSHRGAQCTSIDACIYATHENGEKYLIPIEWKYTEMYYNTDRSVEKGKGKTRLSRYSSLITHSKQLKTYPDYTGTVYFYEPFYQLMRQTLWAEQMIQNKKKEDIEVDNYLHVHVIPSENTNLLEKKYKVSGENMEKTWRNQLVDQSKYKIISPKDLMASLESDYPEFITYLRKRYW
jgi:hypothetical protein